MKVDLTGQVAIVTGAARGIGLGIAKGLVANGATVVFTDKDVPGVKAAAAASEGDAHAMAMDVTHPDEVDTVVPRVAETFGRLDIVVNNAGGSTLEHRTTIDEFPRAEWDRLIDLNLNGVFHVSRAAARIMRKAGRGRIVNIASVCGLVPLRLQCGYTAAKAAVINFTQTMAIELSHTGVLVNAIAPGTILTDGTKKLFYGEDGKFTDAVQRLLSHVPLGRPGSVEEIANAALFLVDPDNGYMTGATVTVDGGWTAGYIRDF